MSTIKIGEITSLSKLLNKRKLGILLVLIILGMLFETLGLGLIIPVINLIINPEKFVEHGWLGANLYNKFTASQLVLMAMFALVMFNFLKASFLTFLSWTQNKFIYGTQATLSYKLFVGYIKQPWSFHLKRNSAQLIVNATNEINVFIVQVLQPFMVLLTESLVLLGIGILLLCLEPLGTSVIVGVLGLFAWSFHRAIKNKLLAWGVVRHSHEGMRVQHLQQGLAGVKDAKILGREDNFCSRYNKYNLSVFDSLMKYKIVTDIPRLWLEFFAVIALGGMVLVVLSQGGGPVSVLPVLSLFAASAFRLMPSINRLLSAVQNIRYGLPVIKTLTEEFELISEPSSLSSVSKPMSFQNEMRVEHLSYQYSETSKDVLSDVSLVIKKGMSVGFIGASGAGKSTLVDVILGLLSPQAGRVTVDGLDIHANLRGWQNVIGYVSQSIYLADDTLLKNIAFGLLDDQIDHAALRKAIKLAQLEDLVENLPDGVNTMVGERGIRLSGGQRQRIGIARAIYHDPEILVFDEATSALDNLTETEVMNAINGFRGKKTLLIIAHRLSTLQKCDQIYNVDSGKVQKVEREALEVVV